MEITADPKCWSQRSFLTRFEGESDVRLERVDDDVGRFLQRFAVVP
jgi:hypothetical protein